MENKLTLIKQCNKKMKRQGVIVRKVTVLIIASVFISFALITAVKYFNRLLWSDVSTEMLSWEEAVDYCEYLNEGGSDNWRLPDISELRTLIRNCSYTEPEGSCNVTIDCDDDSCWGDECIRCPLAIDGRYSMFKDKGEFWSSTSSSNNDKFAWYVGFFDGLVLDGNKENQIFVRCVR